MLIYLTPDPNVNNQRWCLNKVGKIDRLISYFYLAYEGTKRLTIKEYCDDKETTERSAAK